MSNVVKLFPRKQHIKGAAQRALTDAMRSVDKLTGVVIVTVGKGGSIAMRDVRHVDEIKPFDLYARAGAFIEREKNTYFEVQ